MNPSDKQSAAVGSTAVSRLGDGRFAPGNPGGPGRVAGVPNKWTRGARAAMQLAFERMGGVEALAQWGRSNPDQFYTLYARLATTEATHPMASGAVLEALRESSSSAVSQTDSR